MNIKTIHNIGLEAVDNEDIDINIAIKSYTLFTKFNEILTLIVTPKYMSISMDYIVKQDFTLPIEVLDEESFDKLYNKFLELRTDKDLENIQEEQEEVINEEEISLSEFLKNSTDILTSEESAPIIKFVNSLFYQAIKKRASDIHIDMHEHKGQVKFRIDGVLSTHVELDINIMNLIISRIKVVSNLDISEKRIPQDGRTQVKIAGNVLDIRVSVLPTYYGERIVMRILMQSDDIPHLQDLGFDSEISKELLKLSKASYGIILVTGPTGSGKSTTLHALLQEIADPEKNTITIEDPVEYKSENINQIQVNSKVGLTFESGLRSILRQDPDIIMVGEIRDSQTAQIAIQASLTGHLVLSTLHTNNSTASITRLIDMKMEKFLLASSILGVLAQRLVRILCTECKIEDELAESYASEFNFPQNAIIYKHSSCAKCGYTGYIGRRAIGELFVLDSSVQEIIKGDLNDYELREYAIKSGMKPLDDKIRELLLNGETSLDEVIRLGL
jgi:general secretion pathway protein E